MESAEYVGGIMVDVDCKLNKGDLETLLAWNRALMLKALKSKAPDAGAQVARLIVHRECLKDCLLELYRGAEDRRAA